MIVAFTAVNPVVSTSPAESAPRFASSPFERKFAASPEETFPLNCADPQFAGIYVLAPPLPDAPAGPCGPAGPASPLGPGTARSIT